MARDINLGCAMSCAHHFCRHSVCYSCIPANLVSQMVLDRRLLSEYSARYSIFVELLIFITNECAPPTRVKKTINILIMFTLTSRGYIKLVVTGGQ
jgi:hypothetical protein